MSDTPFKNKPDESLLPLTWWENFIIQLLRELPRKDQLKLFDLISRFLMAFRCFGEIKPDTEWLKRVEARDELTANPRRFSLN